MATNTERDPVFPVFNTDQGDTAEALIAATGADFHIVGERAFYVLNGDYVQVPRTDAISAAEHRWLCAHCRRSRLQCEPIRGG